jgi:hypothetical protein
VFLLQALLGAELTSAEGKLQGVTQQLTNLKAQLEDLYSKVSWCDLYSRGGVNLYKIGRRIDVTCTPRLVCKRGACIFIQAAV